MEHQEEELQVKYPKISPSTKQTEINQQVINVYSDVKKEGVDINFENLKYTVQIKVKNQETGKLEPQQKTILNDISGICKQGQLTAIMGSSGAGKTSLLNLLAKRIQKTKTNSFGGSIKANELEYGYDNFSSFATYVMQDDRLMETLTVYEVLMFAAQLKIKGSQKQKESRVNEVIKQLKLERCQNTLIGGKHLKGVSGGERKRTSIAFEIISDPQVMLLDEPTSGLDSFTAFLVINSLKQLAKNYNKTLICTIHQPSSDIWNLFDGLMLMVNGNFIYQGQGGKAPIDFFGSIGFQCPIHSNPADYLMSIMHKESPENRKNYNTYYREYNQQLAGQVQSNIKNKSIKQINMTQNVNNFGLEVKQIASRTKKTMIRNPLLLRARVGQTLFLSLFTSAIYYQLENGEKDPTNLTDMANLTGFLFFQSINVFMTALLSMILTFPIERGVFLKEENGKYYSLNSYFVGRTVLEFPFLIIFPFVQATITFFLVGLTPETDVFFRYFFVCILVSLTGNSLGLLCGSLFSDPKVASGMMPVFIMPFMLFAGFYSNRDNLWGGISWIEYLSPFKYGYDAFMHNEFEESYFRPNPVELYNLDIGYWNSCGIMIGLFFTYRILAFISLWYFKKRLQ